MHGVNVILIQLKFICKKKKKSKYYLKKEKITYEYYLTVIILHKKEKVCNVVKISSIVLFFLGI